LEAARQPFAEGNESASLCKSVNPRLKMQNVFSPELCGVGQGHPPPSPCWLLSCLTLGLKAVLRDNFLTDPNREVSGCLQECTQGHLREKAALWSLQKVEENVHLFELWFLFVAACTGSTEQPNLSLWAVSLWMCPQHSPCSCCLASLCTSNVQVFVQEHKNKKWASSLCTERHTGINGHQLLFLVIAGRIWFTWPWRWMLLCREQGGRVVPSTSACRNDFEAWRSCATPLSVLPPPLLDHPCPLQKWELSLQAAPAAAQRHAALEGCAGAPAFFPACLKKSMARGKHRETSAQLPGQGQSGGPTATWRSLAVPPAPFRRALRSAAHHLQQLCSLACPQEGCGGSRAA